MFTELIFRLRKLFSSQSVKALCVGIEHSKYAGELPGAASGARTIFSKIKPRCYYAKLLIDDEATKSRVMYEMKNVCDSDLAIIIFNCHGGQRPGKQNETDGKDEFLGLYDQPLIDNEIWNIVTSKAKGRVFFIFDSCHSETLFRNIDNLILNERSANPDLLAWSSCSDNTVSYGNPTTGGFLIRTIAKKIRWYKTYAGLWKELSKSKQIAKYEKIKQTILLGGKSKFNKKFILS